MQTHKPEFRFKPAEGGLVKVLGPLETEIMQVVWGDQPTTVKKVHRVLQAKREIAYTTVMTTMTRLAEKGVLSRRRDGLAYIYVPVITKRELEASMIQRVLDGLLDGYREETITYLVDYLTKHHPEQLERLRKAA